MQLPAANSPFATSFSQSATGLSGIAVTNHATPTTWAAERTDSATTTVTVEIRLRGQIWELFNIVPPGLRAVKSLF